MKKLDKKSFFIHEFFDTLELLIHYFLGLFLLQSLFRFSFGDGVVDEVDFGLLGTWISSPVEWFGGETLWAARREEVDPVWSDWEQYL